SISTTSTAFAVVEAARLPGSWIYEASDTGRSLLVTAPALAHPAKRSFVGGLCHRDSLAGNPSYAASILYRFGTFTLWIHGYLQASLNDLRRHEYWRGTGE